VILDPDSMARTTALRAMQATNTLSLCTLLVIVGLGLLARRGLAWRILCLILAAGPSIRSTLLMLLVFSLPT
jgi:hypothetical protein